MSIATLVMLAGAARRMGGPNKLLLPLNDKVVATYALAAARDAGLGPVFAVTGRDAEKLRPLAEAHGAETLHNPAFAEGFGTSLAIGFAALLPRTEIEGAIVLLGDMPRVTAGHLKALAMAFDGGDVIRAADGDRPGNPVLLPRALFAAMAQLEDDQNGRAVISASGLPVRIVDIGPAALADIDTPEAYSALKGDAD